MKKQEARVLVTRAGAAGLRLGRALEVAGWKVIHCPPIELVGPEDPVDCQARLKSTLPVDRLILTSPEGVRQAVALVPASDFGLTPVVVPGPGTAELARKLGFQVVVSPAQSGDSEAMLALPELASVADLRVLILAAAGGRRLLENELRRRGAMVERLHVYQRRPCMPPAGLVRAIINASELLTLVSSGGALAGLRESLGNEAWAAVLAGVLIVPSERVAEMARKQGARRVHSAAGADDQAMIAALQEATMGDQLS